MQRISNLMRYLYVPKLNMQCSAGGWPLCDVGEGKGHSIDK